MLLTVSIVFLPAVLLIRAQKPEISSLILVALMVALGIVVFLHAMFLLQLHQQHRQLANALHITSKEILQAENQVAANFALAQSACAESDALRKAALALTQDLRMDSVLDTLLQSLAGLVPCECARVLLVENKSHLFVARERLLEELPKLASGYPETFDATNFPLLQRVLSNRNSILLPDARQEKDWRPLEGRIDIRSWLCVPLVAAEESIGILAIDHAKPNVFTREHLRLTKSLAASAAAAVQSARLFEQAQLFGSELERRVLDLRAAQNALRHAEGDRRLSEDKFQKVFRSNPIPLSITTVDEGRFLEVNTAFELRYGYRQDELIGRTVHELGIWEDDYERSLVIAYLKSGGPIRNVITRLRAKSGELMLTIYSADRIQFEGHACILAVSEDALKYESHLSN